MVGFCQWDPPSSVELAHAGVMERPEILGPNSGPDRQDDGYVVWKAAHSLADAEILDPVAKHGGPGAHASTGTPQTVHTSRGAGAAKTRAGVKADASRGKAGAAKRKARDTQRKVKSGEFEHDTWKGKMQRRSDQDPDNYQAMPADRKRRGRKPKGGVPDKTGDVARANYRRGARNQINRDDGGRNDYPDDMGLEDEEDSWMPSRPRRSRR